jgi:hypothetical protein
MPRNTVKVATPPAPNPARQSGSQGSRARGSRRRQEGDVSGEDFDFTIDDDDEGSDGLGSQTRTQTTSKSVKADDIVTLFHVNNKIGKKVCTLCG